MAKNSHRTIMALQALVLVAILLTIAAMTLLWLVMFKTPAQAQNKGAIIGEVRPLITVAPTATPAPAQTPESLAGREDALPTVLELTCQAQGNNIYSFSWNETKGEHYELQMRADGDDQWQTLCSVPWYEQRAYTTGRLKSYTHYQFQVVAKGGQTLPNSEFAAIAGQTDVTTASTPVYATVWPIQRLLVFSDSQQSQIIGSVAEGSAHCVLAEENGMFGIPYGTGTGYVDSRYCMINLPECLGGLCEYQISNSEASLFRIHGYPIDQVSDTVIPGYEHVRLSDGSYLAPLLYPVVEKLEKAALSALEQGYRLKIYESFRPKQATREVYDRTSRILSQPLPGQDDPFMAQGESGTYLQLMTDGRYGENSFLAQNTSTHNLGIAMDLTLVPAQGGEDLTMQSDMHDLSFYSEVARNNDNAALLDRIMKEAGFGGLRSEWWHFQDNETRQALDPGALWTGVTPECWMFDGLGWRYRDVEGQYLTNGLWQIGGVDYVFDDQGYASLRQ